jgi:TM2 domain-containing membrane protein YozV
MYNNPFLRDNNMSTFCSSCGVELQNPDEIVCPNCGGEIKQLEETATVAQKKSEKLAAVLSLVLPGLGQLYNGQLGKGIIYFFAYMFCWGLASSAMLYIFPVILLYISILDAYSTASKMCNGEPADNFINYRKDVIKPLAMGLGVVVVIFAILAFMGGGTDTTSEQVSISTKAKTITPQTTITPKQTVDRTAKEFTDGEWSADNVYTIQEGLYTINYTLDADAMTMRITIIATRNANSVEQFKSISQNVIDGLIGTDIAGCTVTWVETSAFYNGQMVFLSQKLGETSKFSTADVSHIIE